MTEQNNQTYNPQLQNAADGKFEDVEYNAEMADKDDLEAVERANQADARQDQS